MARKGTATKLHLSTLREVQTAPDDDLSDGGGPLLRVRGESTSRVFRFTATSGRRREMGLGAVHRGTAAQTCASLTTARKLAHEARDLLQAGTDPIDARERRRDTGRQAEQAKKIEKARQRLTLARAARDYHERVVEPRLTTKHSAQWISSLENDVPAAIWPAPIDGITAPALLSALLDVKPHERARNLTQGDRVPETLRGIRQRLDSEFEDGIFHGHCTTNRAAAARRKMRETVPAKSAGHFAALPLRKAPAFMQRLRQADGTAARCLEFVVLTAARTGEALGATWGEFDLGAGLWVIPAGRMKAKEDHTSHLSPRAVEIVRAQVGKGADLVFTSAMNATGDKAMSNTAMLAVLDRMGVRDRTTVHGLARATFSTWDYETAAARPCLR